MNQRRTLITGLTLLVALALAAPFAVYMEPRLAGTDESRVVLSGSMEPAIDTGDVVLIDHVPVSEVQEGDVVTFRAHANADTTYTHRVVDITTDERGTVLTTKGDANDQPDPMDVDDEMLIGTVDHTIPKLGLFIGALQSQLVPVALVVLSIVTIGHEATRLLELNDGTPNAGSPSDAATEPRTFRVVDER